jgi:hypothetical protein
VAALLGVPDHKWLPHLFPNMVPALGDSLRVQLGIADPADIYGDTPKFTAPWSQVVQALQAIHDQANGVTVYTKAQMVNRVKWHPGTSQTLGDTFAEVTRRFHAAHGPPLAAQDSEYALLRNTLIISAFLNALPAEHKDRLHANPATGWARMWCPTWPRPRARALAPPSVGASTTLPPAPPSAPTATAPHHGNGGRHSNGSRHAGPSGSRPSGSRPSGSKPSGSKQGGSSRQGGWDPNASYKAVPPQRGLEYRGKPWKHQGGQLDDEQRQWYYDHSICFKCGLCGHNPKSCRESAN